MSTEENEQNNKFPFKKRRRRRRRRKGGRPADRQNRDRNVPIQSPESQRTLLCAPPHYPQTSTNKNSSIRWKNMSKKDSAILTDYLNKLPNEIVENLYSGMGGQPKRLSSKARLIQLTVRALSQENRISGLLKGLHQRDRQALCILLQCGGIAHNKEFIDELVLSLAGSENEWLRSMGHLSSQGLLATSEKKGEHFFYLIPSVLIPFLVEVLQDELRLPLFTHEDMRIIDHRPFTPPFNFSLVTLATYIDQHPPRLTQQRDIFKTHKEELDEFFAQLWEPSSDLFNFHLEFLMRHGLVELRGDRIGLNRTMLEEWLNLGIHSQRSLILAELDRQFVLAEWLFWVLNQAEDKWISERPLQALYRRWRRGDDWRQRFHGDEWIPQKNMRDSYSFAPLVSCGFVELGQWGREKFYRLSPRSKSLLTKPQDDFKQFYLTPSFDIVAPAGLPANIFWRVGELAELMSCDRTNTYKLTQANIELALDKGWRREDILDFLRNHSQIGIPENVEQTLRNWIGHRGDIEFHEASLLLVHRSQIKRFESMRQFKPYILHRFVPGLYAIDPARKDDLKAQLKQLGFEPAKADHTYLQDTEHNKKNHLEEMLTEARELQLDLIELAQTADSNPEKMYPISVTKRSTKKKSPLPPRTSPREAKQICEQAIQNTRKLKMLYVTRTQQRRLLQLNPERLAVTAKGNQVLVATDMDSGERLSYSIAQIERLKML